MALEKDSGEWMDALPGSPGGIGEEVFIDNPPGVRRALSASTAGIAGAGGIGSNVAMLLARAGIGRLVAVDHDFVSMRNLNRQAYFADQVGMPKVEALAENIRRLGTGTQFRAVAERLVPGGFCRYFEGCSILIEALDDASTKVQALEEWLTEMKGTPIVAVSGIAGAGDPGGIRTERHGSVILVGDQSSDLSLGTLSARVSLAASIMACEAVSVLLGMCRDDGGSSSVTRSGSEV
ncbi:MAG: sulfur carrier protein ThiS adenylyltransferase ThiF [Candidatus Fermentibacter sp.]|nr:sulfur carrier protein ThiS adenylyltransferase ThiF [Candidatus Fermentibacter sp.]